MHEGQPWLAQAAGRGDNPIEVAIVARKNANLEDDIIDLTELIESGDKGDARTVSTDTAPLEEAEDDDFAAILAETTGTPAHKVDPDEQLDMSGMGDIDNLLESLDIPPQPKSSAPRQDTGQDDLDSALDELLGNSDSPAPGPQIDTDLGSAPAGEAPKTASSQPTGSAPKPASAPETDIEDDLDLLLAEAPAAAKKSPASQDESTPLDPGQPTTKAEEKKSSAMADLDADLDDILSSFDDAGPAVPKPAQTDESSLAADLDDILGEVELAQEAPEEPEIEPMKAAAPEELDLLPPETSETDGEAAIDKMIDGHEDSPAPETSLPAEMPEDLLPAKSKNHESEHGAQIQSYALSPETLVGLCRNLGAAQEGPAQQALHEFARELGEQTAHIQDMGAQLAQLGKRLLACESKLSAARARIASLEKAMESAAAIEDLLKEGSPLHSGFMSLISTAVANALHGFSLPAGSQLDEKVEKLDKDVESITGRTQELESRLNEMRESTDSEIGRLIESNDNNNVKLDGLEKKISAIGQESANAMEKAAAATVARIIHEEISRLAQI